jgi:glycosyltransferase involved in cell wall biosynthesis
MTTVLRLAWECPAKDEINYGLGPVFYNLSVEQARQGYSVHVISTRRKGEPAEAEEDGVQIHRADAPFNLSALKLLTKLRENSHDQIIHSHSTCGLFYPAIKPVLRTPLVSHIHGTTHTHFSPKSIQLGEAESREALLDIALSTFREKFIWSRADALVLVSEAIATDLLDYYRLRPSIMKVVNNGVDTSYFRPQAQVRMPPGFETLEGRDIILFVGHFGYREGLYFLLKAMKDLKNEFPNARLACIGGTPKWLRSTEYWSALNGWIKEFELDGRVTLLDSVPHTSLANYYAAAKVFILPSYYESFAKVALEAAASGLPVVATDRGGLREIVQDGVTGFLVPFGDSEAISDRISRILSDERLSKELGARARRRVEENFTWMKVVQRISTVYQMLLSN